jgi:hypothetical protein
MKPIQNSISIIWQLARRLPFTLLSLGLLVVVGLITQTHIGALSKEWLASLGFAPTDLWEWRLERLVTSALVTQGGRVFWEVLGIMAVALGLAEWLAGTRRALLTFWGVHLATLLIESTAIWLLRHWGGAQFEAYTIARDVGPSAGYFGCLGLACGRLPGRWRWATGSVILLGLVAAFFLPGQAGQAREVKLFADLAHLLAFPFGWLSARMFMEEIP